ncbi:similar to Saccharomyces cerevisiae YPL186C UIP4 Protein that interacts with Ulp1p, a Ubl (ubiquitin-like protein)-specific protease for Smt3p protein conjugates [Maudiozyma barnettii]|uniref:Similar to Saccharomyces cerevisiae YPL186C UIP4 Protein that interacts with Ulp1p, a Ubl (Ubiquitin-like protein)-specific protease for Smt3p protein conjugates n=1 Tax=Maudiozyma barnettii TaxID=61262 RepID=A0A8H2ZJ77_9SACH|nr:Uip4p [Kazachstania barnettii]CAB4256703.1 similar to Saccharomyces cerevisiae YPL186C UIP4 Protein that interacts with Ulp1p, a Ubl (ubiquitin-like protein)-specific protease for Smt3p protein conjugates [Kazachstania barnettii]CAD1785359.1 similar to Saccharomyces cerevisiae YPL186C UIP4 Protein that interacts with Ulp1p, a Ubl (ubiquitin-like protein)-specific protease for Smt3p protein conjugates [Kazachstania barnettii]
MVEILIPDEKLTFKALKIAGDFTAWKIQPMVLVSKDESVEHIPSWRFVITDDMIKDYCTEESSNETMIHFKFIDDGDNWFTSDNFDLIPDENNNINNGILLQFENGKLKEETNIDIDDTPESSLIEPVLQDLTPDPSLENIAIVKQTSDDGDNGVATGDEDEDTAMDTINEEQPVPLVIPQTPIKSGRGSPVGDETVFFSPGMNIPKGLDVTEDEDEAETPAAERAMVEKLKEDEINNLMNKEVRETKDPEAYKGMLQRLIDFISAFFGSWFHFFTGGNKD